jgi:hypothetical protein
MPSPAHALFARRLTALILCLGSIAGILGLTIRWNTSGVVLMEARSQDGQPEVWESHPDVDESVVAFDTNLDGRPDERLHYRNGDLVSLEADSDFDNRVDIVEEFDPITHEVVRSLIDVDEDGRADVLVLRQDGQPVFEKWAHQIAPRENAWISERRATTVFTSPANPLSDDSDLIPLADPFTGDLAVRSAHSSRPASRDGLLSTSGGLPLPATVISCARSSVSVRESAFHSPLPSAFVPTSPRGPPMFSPSPAAFL